MTTILILLNPYNLIASFFALSGLAIWGAGSTYKIDSSFITLFKIFAVPTIMFALVWFGIKKWKKINYWKMYFFSFVVSLILLFVISQVYWGFVGRK